MSYILQVDFPFEGPWESAMTTALKLMNMKNPLRQPSLKGFLLKQA